MTRRIPVPNGATTRYRSTQVIADELVEAAENDWGCAGIAREAATRMNELETEVNAMRFALATRLSISTAVHAAPIQRGPCNEQNT